MKELVEKLLQEIGEDPSREGLKNTPERVEKSLKFLTSGYWVNIEELVNGALFHEDYDEMVIVKNIDLESEYQISMEFCCKDRFENNSGK